MPDVSLRQIPSGDSFPYLSAFFNIHLFLRSASSLSLSDSIFLLHSLFRKTEATQLYFALANIALFIYFLELGIVYRYSLSSGLNWWRNRCCRSFLPF